MRKLAIRILLGITFIFIIIIGYTFRDNHRFILVEEEIRIGGLPEQIEEFRILQISDLHDKQFGRDHQQLLEKINSIEYDIIIFTGDMLDSKESTVYESFYTLIEGIENKEHALFVRGNTDPESYVIDQTVEKSDFIEGMEERGIKLLESIYSISNNGDYIHFTDFELSIVNDPQQLGEVEGIEKSALMQNEQFLTYQREQLKELEAIKEVGKNDTIIGLNHYPVSDVRIDHIQEHPSLIWRDYDLILAGHYHGGQIRLPFLGALFVPEPWYEPNSFFPPKDRVKGLWAYAGVKQYVSAGLGSSSAIPFLKFRLFNTPEINLIKLSK